MSDSITTSSSNPVITTPDGTQMPRDTTVAINPLANLTQDDLDQYQSLQKELKGTPFIPSGILSLCDQIVFDLLVMRSTTLKGSPNELLSRHTYREIQSLRSLIDVILKCREQETKSADLDPASPQIQAVYRFFLEKACEVLAHLGWGQEQMDEFYNLLSDNLKDGVKELRDRLAPLKNNVRPYNPRIRA